MYHFVYMINYSFRYTVASFIIFSLSFVENDRSPVSTHIADPSVLCIKYVPVQISLFLCFTSQLKTKQLNNIALLPPFTC